MPLSGIHPKLLRVRANLGSQSSQTGHPAPTGAVPSMTPMPPGVTAVIAGSWGSESSVVILLVEISWREALGTVTVGDIARAEAPDVLAVPFKHLWILGAIFLLKQCNEA